jgi:hypothetical protein
MVARRTVWLLVATIAALLAYAAAPRQVDLRGFDPAEMARLETAMWRDITSGIIRACSITSTNHRGRSSGFRHSTAFASRWRPRRPQKPFSRRIRVPRSQPAAPRRLLRPAARRGTGRFRDRGDRKSRARLVAGAARAGCARRLRRHDRARRRIHLWRAGRVESDARLWRRPGSGDGVSRCPRRRHHRTGLVQHRSAIARGLPAAQACDCPAAMNAGEPPCQT